MSFRKFISEDARLLLEYNSDITWKQHGEKVKARAHWHQEHNGEEHEVLAKANSTYDKSGPYGPEFRPHKGPEEEEVAMKQHLLPHLEKTDPTPNKKYVQHVARIFGAGGVNRFEDLHSRMKPALAKFDDLAKRKVIPAEHRDIGRIKSLGQLEDLVDAHSESKSNNEVSREYHEKMKKQSTVTDHGTFTHVVPHTEEAANYWGRGTRWCTTSDNAEEYGMGESAFKEHNDQGPLHIYIPKNPQYKDEKGRQEKYQYHYATGQFMNEKDEPAHTSGDVGKSGYAVPEDIRNHVKDYQASIERDRRTPAALNHPEKAMRGDFLENFAKPEHFEPMLRTAPAEDIRHLAFNREFTGAHAMEVLKHNPDDGAKILASKNDWFDDHDRDAIKNEVVYGDHTQDVKGALGHYYATRLNKDDLHHITDRAIKTEHSSWISLAAKHPLTSEEDRNRLYNETGEDGQYHLSMSPHATPDMLAKLAAGPHDRIASEAILNKNSTPDVAVAALKNHETRSGIWGLDQLHSKWKDDDEGRSKIVRAAQEHPDHGIRMAAAEHARTHNDIQRSLADEDPKVRANVFKMNQAHTATHVDEGIHDIDPQVRKSAINSPHLSDHHVDHVVFNEKDPHVQESLFVTQPTRDKLHSHHIDHLIGSDNDRIAGSAALHPAASHAGIMKAATHSAANVRVGAMDNPNAQPEHLAVGIKDENTTVARAAAKHPNATKEILHAAFNHPEPRVVRAALLSPSPHLDTESHEYKTAFDKYKSIGEDMKYGFKDFITELSPSTLNSYKRKAQIVVDHTPETDKAHKKSKKGIERATRKLGGFKAFAEDVQPISDKVKIRHPEHEKAYVQAQGKGWKSSNKHGKVKFWNEHGKKSAFSHAGINEDTNVVDNSSEDLIMERKVLTRDDPAKYATVKRFETKSAKVRSHHTEKEKSMHDHHRTETALKLGFRQRRGDSHHLTDKSGHQLTDRWRDQNRKRLAQIRNPKKKKIAEGVDYIDARQKLHDAHAEAARQHAGMERDPELRRLDLHRAKKHSIASRVLDILKARTKKK